MQRKTCVFITRTVVKEHSRTALYNHLHNRLADAQIHFRIVAYHEDECLQSCKESRLIPTVSFLGKSRLKVIRWVKLLGVLRRLRPDHLLIGGYGHVENWIAWCFARYAGKPCTLWTGAGSTTTRNRGTARNLLKKLFVKHTDNFIAYGTQAHQYLQELGVNGGAVSVAKNVSDTEFFSQTRIQYMRSPEFEDKTRERKHRLLVFAGRLEKRKGIDLLIEQLSNFDPESYFLYVIGRGSLAHSIQAGLHSGRVNGEFLGHLGREDLAKRLVEADVYICPTLNDPFTRSLSEALASGCFTLSSIYDDASKDLVHADVNGFVFDPLDAGDFSQKLSHVLSTEWKRPSRDFIASTQRFTTEQYAEVVTGAVLKALDLKTCMC